MNYTKDYLPNTNIDIYQDKDMFRMNTDTALLGTFIKVNNNDKVLDIGTNNGALLLYASRYSNYLYGIDILEEAINVAKYNFNYHKLDSSNLINTTLQEYKSNIRFDVIICNPPYFKGHNPERGKNYFKNVARHEMYLSLEELASNVSRLLNDNGRYYMVHRAERLTDIIITFNKYNLQATEIKFMYDDNKDNAISVLIEFKRDYENIVTIKKPVFLSR